MGEACSTTLGERARIGLGEAVNLFLLSGTWAISREQTFPAPEL